VVFIFWVKFCQAADPAFCSVEIARSFNGELCLQVWLSAESIADTGNSPGIGHLDAGEDTLDVVSIGSYFTAVTLLSTTRFFRHI